MSENDWKSAVLDVDAFWNEETAPVVQGRVANIVEMQLANRPTIVAIVQLTKPCKGVTGSKREKKEVALEVGQYLGVVVKHKLAIIERMVENQNEVAIKAVGKDTLENGNTLWMYDVKYRGALSRLAAPRTRTSAPSNASGDEGGGSNDSDFEPF